MTHDRVTSCGDTISRLSHKCLFNKLGRRCPLLPYGTPFLTFPSTSALGLRTFHSGAIATPLVSPLNCPQRHSRRPWFVAEDVWNVLGHGNASQAVERLDEDERGGCLIPTPVARDVALVLGFRDAVNAVRGLDSRDKGTRIASTPGSSPTTSAACWRSATRRWQLDVSMTPRRIPSV